MEYNHFENGLRHIRSNEENFEQIIDTYSTDIFRLAYSYVKSKDQADDITQTVLLKCFTQFEQFKGNNLKSWLYKITVNCCKDYFRSWHYKKTLISDNIIAVIKEKSPEDIIMEKNESRLLSDAVLSLPIKYREIVYLHYFEGLSLIEISNLLDSNLNTIKTRHKRAKELLKKCFRERGI